MPYCIVCGMEISEHEAQIHYNRCNKCVQNLTFCFKCDKIISEQETSLYHGQCFSCHHKTQQIQPQISTSTLRVYPPVFGFRGRNRILYHTVFIIYIIILLICIIMALLFDKYGFLYLIVVIAIISPFLFFLYKKNKSKKINVKYIKD